MNPRSHSALAPLLKIEGPPGSGKSRELAREACRLIVEEGIAPSHILMLAATSQNRHRLGHYLHQEAELAGLTEDTTRAIHHSTWDAFLLSLLPPISSGAPTGLLTDTEAQILLHEVLRQVIPAEHPLFEASRQLSFARIFFESIRQMQLQGLTAGQLNALAAQNLSPDSRLPLLSNVFQRFQTQLQTANLLCPAELMHRAAAYLAASPEVADSIALKYKAILVDEAQELAPALHAVLSQLPSKLILAGHHKLSIRSFRGASPEEFTTLSAYANRPVTHVPKLACMRGNEAILSLLNTFLPDPIWEEQKPDLAQLKTMVGFSLACDPESEAEQVALRIKQFIASSSEDGRPFRWDDCLVLLRSGRYKEHLVNAFLKHGLPFRSETLSEQLFHWQHALYDALQIIRFLENAGLASAQPSADLTEQLAQWSFSTTEKQARIDQSNRHLRRWLESDLMAQAELLVLPIAEPGESLLSVLTSPAALSPPLQSALDRLDDAYQSYREQSLGANLASSLVAKLLPISVQSDSDTSVTSEVQDGLNAFLENVRRLDTQYRQAFNRSLPLSELLAHYPRLWDGLEKPAERTHENRIRLLSIHQAQGEEAPLVLIPFLVEGEFPHSREMPEILSETDSQQSGIEAAYRINEAEEARLLAVGMSRATRQLWLSGHQTDAGAPVLPSPFYTRLLLLKQALLGEEIAACPTDANFQESVSELQERQKRYLGHSQWAQLAQQAAEPLFQAEETLQLSASSIKTYMSCPRQFYYKHLLKLPQPGSDAANLGSLVHRLMEVFNRQASSGAYTLERLRELAGIMFDFKENPDTFLAAGFQESDRLVLAHLSHLGLNALKQRLLEAVEDLAAKGYFQHYGQPKAIESEKVLDSFTLEGIERCRFSGIVDALIHKQDGTWDLIDYKTFRSAYGASGLDTCDKHFKNTLAPLPDDETFSHAERFAEKLSPSYPKDYQLPLYYLACRDQPAYQGQLKSVALQIIRPAFPGNERQGAIRLALSDQEIEAAEPQIIADINRYVVNPILGSQSFAADPSPFACGQCGYSGICDIDADQTEAEESA